jgi:2-polyprenyl-3-methyl-5-hydroxy-6-metoxy-1,4-benzoquinol methylase
VLQRVRLELYRDNLAGALRLLAEADAVTSATPDLPYRRRAEQIRSTLRHLESRQAYARAYEAFYARKKGGFSLRRIERAIRMLVGRRARSIVRHVAGDPEFHLLERELLFDDARQVLDAGCGEGRIAITLASRHPRVRVVGIEVSPTNIRLARRTNRFANAEFCLGLVEESPSLLTPGSFDLVYAFAVLEHVRDVEEAVAAMLRMLRPGGRLCFVVPMNEFEARGPLPDREPDDGVAGHVRVFTETELRAAFGHRRGFALSKLPGTLPAYYPETLVPREFGSFFVAFSA